MNNNIFKRKFAACLNNYHECDQTPTPATLDDVIKLLEDIKGGGSSKSSPPKNIRGPVADTCCGSLFSSPMLEHSRAMSRESAARERESMAREMEEKGKRDWEEFLECTRPKETTMNKDLIDEDALENMSEDLLGSAPSDPSLFDGRYELRISNDWRNPTMEYALIPSKAITETNMNKNLLDSMAKVEASLNHKPEPKVTNVRPNYYSGEYKDLGRSKAHLRLDAYPTMDAYTQAFMYQLICLARTPEEKRRLVVDYLPFSRDDKGVLSPAMQIKTFIHLHKIHVIVLGPIHTDLSYIGGVDRRGPTPYITSAYDYAGVDFDGKYVIALDASEHDRLHATLGIIADNGFDKVRENGVVISQKLVAPYNNPDNKPILFVDDILGGGATLKMAWDAIKDLTDQPYPQVHVGYKEKIFKYDAEFPNITYQFTY